MSEEICIGLWGTGIICLLLGFSTLFAGTLEQSERDRKEARHYAMLWLTAFAISIAAGGILAVAKDEVLVKDSVLHSH